MYHCCRQLKALYGAQRVEGDEVIVARAGGSLISLHFFSKVVPPRLVSCEGALKLDGWELGGCPRTGARLDGLHVGLYGELGLLLLVIGVI